MDNEIYQHLASHVPGMVKERRKSAAELRRKLRADRRRLKATMQELAAAYPFNDATRSRAQLTELCEALVEYVSFSHYGVFWRINNGEERREQARLAARSIYPKLQESTRVMVEFSERHRAEGSRALGRALTRELSAMGRHVIARFALEDRLLRTLSEKSLEEDRPETLSSAA